MTELLKAAIASGQASAAQIEAHRAAGDLPTPCLDASIGEHACANRAQCWEPCGELGHSEEHVRVAGDQPITMREPALSMSMFASKADFDAAIGRTQKPQTLREIIDGATSEDMHVMVPVAALRAVLDDAERYRFLRAQPIDGEPGQPVIAVPNGMKSGYYMNDENADFAVDAAMKATQ